MLEDDAVVVLTGRELKNLGPSNRTENCFNLVLQNGILRLLMVFMRFLFSDLNKDVIVVCVGQLAILPHVRDVNLGCQVLLLLLVSIYILWL